MGRRRYRRTRHRRNLVITFVVVLVCLGVLVAVAVNALSFERSAPWVPVLVPD
jgi:ABC-type transporter Mla subunit MlaD